MRLLHSFVKLQTSFLFMKLKNTNIIALRILAIAASIISAHAAVVNVTTTNFTSVAGSFPDTINANAGGATSVTIVAGSFITGDAAATSALNVNVVGYTTFNSGTLQGNGAAAAATVAATTTINNQAFATIRSTTGEGISITAGTGSVINNSNLIEGGNDAIFTSTNTLTVNNLLAISEIRGITGVGSDGIQAQSGLTVVNNGKITGNQNAIDAANTATITNNAGAFITGTTSTAVLVGNNLILNNSGTITTSAVAANGVEATSDATITNFAGGVITGGNDGVQLTTGASVGNAGSITGTADDGIQLTDGTVTNNLGGVILGADRGIVFSGAGIVNNSATITGGPVGIDFAGALTIDTLNMFSGTITGTTAVSFGSGNDIASIQGGQINGILDGGASTTILGDQLNFDGGTASIVGNVNNFETIVRNGTGVATITGTTEADNLTVTAGSLYLNGNITAETVPASDANIVINGGELGGIGLWDANVTQNGGNLTAGTGPSAIGNLTINNDLDVFNGANLLVHINAASGARDLITVSGNANISNGQILLSPNTQDAPLQSASTQVLDVVGTRAGQYSAATFFFESGHTDAGSLQATAGNGLFTSSTVSLSVVNNPIDADDVNVRVVHHYDTVAGLNDFAQQFGASLNNRVAESLVNPDLADFLGFLDYSNQSTVECVMNAYTPESFQASQSLAIFSARELYRIVEQQNASDRLFPSGHHAWGNFNYNDLTDEGTSMRYTLGAGTSFAGAQVGVLVSMDTVDITDNSDMETLSYGLYFASGEQTGWQWNAYVGASHSETSTIIDSIICAEVPAPYHFDPKGDGMQFLISGAYMMEEGCVTWGPTFGFEYTTSEIDGTISPGPNLPDMEFNASRMESARSLLGLRADFNFGSAIRPYASAQWAHEFEGDSSGYNVNFLGSSFGVNSPMQLGEDAIILRAGVIAQITDTFTGDLGYLGEMSLDDGTDSNGVNVGLRASF